MISSGNFKRTKLSDMWILAKIIGEQKLDISGNNLESDVSNQDEDDMVIFDLGEAVFITNSIEMLEDKMFKDLPVADSDSNIPTNSQIQNPRNDSEGGSENDDLTFPDTWIKRMISQSVSLGFFI
jgi:hypothetical protein